MKMFAKISATEKSNYKNIPINEDRSVSLSVLRKSFPNCTGIRYRCKLSGNLRGTHVFGDSFYLPLGMMWEDYVFHCVLKDIQENKDDQNQEKDCSIVDRLQLETFDMIALGLPDNITDDLFYQYFNKFGELKFCELRKNLKQRKSKGYGFLRYHSFHDQNECIKTEHVIAGAEVSLRIPTAKMDSETCRKKLFITNITPSVSQNDILEYFSVFGKITQIFMPPVSCPYAFLTFDSEDSIDRVFQIGESHRVFGGYVFVEHVYTKQEINDNHISQNSNPRLNCTNEQKQSEHNCTANDSYRHSEQEEMFYQRQNEPTPRDRHYVEKDLQHIRYEQVLEQLPPPPPQQQQQQQQRYEERRSYEYQQLNHPYPSHPPYIYQNNIPTANWSSTSNKEFNSMHNYSSFPSAQTNNLCPDFVSPELINCPGVSSNILPSSTGYCNPPHTITEQYYEKSDYVNQYDKSY